MKPSENGMSNTWALLPLKSLAKAKGRLAPILDPVGRRTLLLAMAQDVLAALSEVRSIDRILLVSNEPEAGNLLRNPQLEIFYSAAEEGLNRELEQAAALAARRGADRVLILHADLPYVTTRALERFLAACPAGGMCAAACKLGTGTNALLAPLPLPIPLAFGANSLRKFGDLAEARGYELNVINDPNLSVDIDSPEDFTQHLGARKTRLRVGPSTRNALKALDLRRTANV